MKMEAVLSMHYTNLRSLGRAAKGEGICNYPMNGLFTRTWRVKFVQMGGR